MNYQLDDFLRIILTIESEKFNRATCIIIKSNVSTKVPLLIRKLETREVGKKNDWLNILVGIFVIIINQTIERVFT